MILKHRDTDVLRFDWVEPFGVKNVELNRSAERFLPLAYRDRVIGKDERTLAYETEEWLLHRTAPMRRECIEDALRYLEFSPHPEFTMPDKRLELSQYFLQNRIAKIIKYREKADRYLKIRAKNDTINPTISDKMLKKAQEAADLRRELKSTLWSFPRANTAKLAKLFKTTTRTIARHIKSLQDSGELKRIGSRKTGYWQVIDKNEETQRSEPR